MFSIATLFTIMLTQSAGEVASNGTPTDDWDVVTALREQIFDPHQLFNESGFLGITVYIEARGDDFDWPVQSVAFRIQRNPRCGEAVCANSWSARMNRAEPPPNSNTDDENFRPRRRGRHLVSAFYYLKGQEPESTADELLGQLPIEYLQASSADCPPVWEHLQTVAEQNWIEERDLHTIGNTAWETPYITLHADRYNIEIASIQSSSAAYDMVPRHGNIAGWAHELMTALENCWQPRD
ncbi:MAG: hypothetical protein P8P99_04525 [Maricaulis sp.]|nr:hypothetical protein [Maricaulis sp.]